MRRIPRWVVWSLWVGTFGWGCYEHHQLKLAQAEHAPVVACDCDDALDDQADSVDVDTDDQSDDSDDDAETSVDVDELHLVVHARDRNGSVSIDIGNR